MGSNTDGEIAALKAEIERLKSKLIVARSALVRTEDYLVPRCEIPPRGREGRLEVLPKIRGAISLLGRS